MVPAPLEAMIPAAADIWPPSSTVITPVVPVPLEAMVLPPTLSTPPFLTLIAPSLVMASPVVVAVP